MAGAALPPQQPPQQLEALQQLLEQQLEWQLLWQQLEWQQLEWQQLLWQQSQLQSQLQQPWPATACVSPPIRAIPTTAKKIATANNNARFMLASSKLENCNPMRLVHQTRLFSGKTPLSKGTQIACPWSALRCRRMRHTLRVAKDAARRTQHAIHVYASVVGTYRVSTDSGKFIYDE